MMAHATDINYHQSQLAALYPQEAGSKNEKITVDYILAFLQRESIRYEMEDLSRSQGIHSFFRNIYVRIDGVNTEMLTVAISLNTSSSNIAIGLELIRYYHMRRPPLSLQFVFLGDEKQADRYTGTGTALLLSDSRRANSIAVIHLDIAQSIQYFSLDIGDVQNLAPGWMLTDLYQSLSESPLSLYLPPLYATVIRNQQFTVLKNRQPQSLPATVMRQGIPALSLIAPLAGPNLLFRDRTALVSLQEYFDLLTSFIDVTAQRNDRSWDSNYIIIPWFSNIFVLGEFGLLMLLLIFLAGAAVGVVYRTRTAHVRYLRLVRRYWWNIPLVFGTLYILLVVSSYLLLMMGTLHAVDAIWSYRPLFFIFSMIVLTDLLFQIVQKNIMTKSPIPIGRYYSIAALLTAVLGILIISSINLAYSVVILWIALCTLLFSLARVITLKLILLVFSFVVPIIFFVVLLLQIDTQSGEYSVYTPLLISVPIALMINPFYFMMLRIRRVRRVAPSWRLRLGIPALLLSISLGYILVTSPFSTNRPQPIFVEELIEMPAARRSLSVRSPARFGYIDLLYGERRIHLENSDSAYQVALTGNSPVNIQYDSLEIDNSLFHSFEIISPQAISLVVMTIYSNTPFHLSDSIYPVHSLSNNSSIIQIGHNPPSPLLINFYTERVSLTVEFEISLKDSLVPIRVISDNGNALAYPVSLMTDTRVKLIYDIES